MNSEHSYLHPNSPPHDQIRRMSSTRFSQVQEDRLQLPEAQQQRRMHLGDGYSPKNLKLNTPLSNSSTPLNNFCHGD
jgi:hypothetical protein